MRELLVNCDVSYVQLFVPRHTAGPVVRGMHIQAQYVSAKLQQLAPDGHHRPSA